METFKKLEPYQGFYIAEYDSGIRINRFPKKFENEQAAHKFIDAYKSADPIVIELPDSILDSSTEIRLVDGHYYDGYHAEYYKMDDDKFVHSQGRSRGEIKILYDNGITQLIHSQVQ